MKATVAALLLLAACCVPSFATTRNCTAGMVTLGICRSTADVAMCVPISTVDPDGGGPLVAPSVLAGNALAANFGWAASMVCTAEMVAASICSSGQIGASTPISKAQFADLMVKRWLLAQIKAYRQQQEQQAAAAAVEVEPTPDVGN